MVSQEVKNLVSSCANPIGTDGFEFVEFTSSEPEQLGKLFEKIGFIPIARHRSKQVTLYRQGDIHFILNAEETGFAREFSNKHGPSACSMAFRVKDAEVAYKFALSKGAKPYKTDTHYMEQSIPAIYGIGDSLLYFVDLYESKSIYDVDFEPIIDANFNNEGVGLISIDHLTHNLHQGHMDHWANFYENLFNFKEIRSFDIQGKHTGLISRAMGSPCGKIRIPLNESKDDQSQIEEFLSEYNGEGIQHIAFSTNDIYKTVESLRGRGMEFMDTPDTYYEMIGKRLPTHNEDIARMQKNRILIDGGESQGGGLLLQIFTNTVIGPIFFEIIQRKGNKGFGEGNFQALFDSIELDQLRRGVISISK
jgi:4-hydroxyphenylpyruvate dioxygenase